MRTWRKVWLRLLVYGALVLFLAAVFLPGFRKARVSGPPSPLAEMEDLWGICEFYRSTYAQYPSSEEGSDEALRLAVRHRFGGEISPEWLDGLLQQGWGRRRPGEVDYLYLNHPQADLLPDDTIMVVEKCAQSADGKLHVVTIAGEVSIIDPAGLSAEQVLGRRLSEFATRREEGSGGSRADPASMSPR